MHVCERNCHKVSNEREIPVVISLGILFFVFHCFIPSSSYCNGDKIIPPQHRMQPPPQKETTNSSEKTTGEFLRGIPLQIRKNDAISNSFKQEISPRPKIVEQKIIFRGDKKEAREIGLDGLDKKVDSSIYFSTFVVVILAFLLQGLRIWISELRQNWFTTMAFLLGNRSWDEKKYFSVKDKLYTWYEEVDKAVKFVNVMFGVAYFALIFTLFILALYLLHWSSKFYFLLSVLLCVIIVVSAISLVTAMARFMFKSFICKGYGGVARSLRRLQKEAIEAAQGKGKEKKKKEEDEKGGKDG